MIAHFIVSNRLEWPADGLHAPAQRPVVCHVLHALDVGGGEVLARELALKHAGEFKPIFALLDSLGSLGRELKRAGYIVKVCQRKPGFDVGCVRSLASLFRQERVSIIHAHQYAPLFYSALARLPTMRIPILLTEHGRDYPDYRRWKRVLANRCLLGRSDRFIAVGQCVRRALIDNEGLPDERVDVIYNGRDLTAYDPRRLQRSAVREELGLESDALVIMQVARLDRLKDHSTAIRAMAEIRAAVPEANLLLIGDGEQRPLLERLINELALGNCVRLLGTRPDVPRLLQAADIFLLSSISEGIPLTLIEAMATELPCVATRVGGVAEVVIEGETGLLADAGQPSALAKQLWVLATDRDLRARLGRAGHRRAAQHFDAVQMHMAYARHYRGLTALSVGPRGAERIA